MNTTENLTVKKPFIDAKENDNSLAWLNEIEMAEILGCVVCDNTTYDYGHKGKKELIERLVNINWDKQKCNTELRFITKHCGDSSFDKYITEMFASYSNDFLDYMLIRFCTGILYLYPYSSLESLLNYRLKELNYKLTGSEILHKIYYKLD